MLIDNYVPRIDKTSSAKLSRTINSIDSGDVKGVFGWAP